MASNGLFSGISFNPFDYLFGSKKPSVQNTTPQSTPGGSSIATPLNTTTIAGYLILAGLTIYIVRKVV